MAQPAFQNVMPLDIQKIRQALVAVTPEMAERWLKQNHGNRTIRQGKVKLYARLMAEGKWTFDSSSICFDTEGKLLNGQHRLIGVVESGQTITFTVSRNVPTEAMKNMDTGAPRQAQDVLRWEGYQYASVISAAARLALIHERGLMFSDRRAQAVSHAELSEFTADNPAIVRSSEIASRVKRSVDMPQSVTAFCHWLFTVKVDSGAATEFMYQLAERVGWESGSALQALDNKLREARRLKVVRPQRDLAAVTIKAFNYWRRGKGVSTLAWPSPQARELPKVER